MGHVSAASVNRLKYVTVGVKELLCSDQTVYDVCVSAKLHRKTFDKGRERATRPCEILHTDLIGPINAPTFCKRRI